jgi:hydrogenase maturation protein HypF
MTTSTGLKIHVTGIVQGVGFRPFVYGLANRFHLTGWVRNTASGVDIEVDGSSELLDLFLHTLRDEAPPLARIDTFDSVPQHAQGYTSFQIVHSSSRPDDFIPISPDVCICSDCLHELFDPIDRRYHYPFINCTNCGPRFSIITEIPYDRPNTTMRGFPLCPGCYAEYNHPLNRRFHAQPVACPICGPKIWLEYVDQDHPQIRNTHPEDSYSNQVSTDDIIRETQETLLNGKIIAIKGLGGFHLACDATQTEAVITLRNRKLRVDKPFAVMMPNIDAVERHCYLNENERELLQSIQRPIVILHRRAGSTIVPQVAPGQDTIGVMLPYTPLHYLLFADLTSPSPNLPPSAYVMTSGNLSEEPIATDNEEARPRLSDLCDAFLMHDRPIRTRCDDSVLRASFESMPKAYSSTPFKGSQPLIFRRSRGYAPDPIQLPFEVLPLLATGPELKNTFCLTRGPYAFISHHIGDLENYETLQSFEDGITHYERLFRIKPGAIACDLHPNYLATRYALERAQREELPIFEVQHHHAHIAACMADNGLAGNEPVIGVAFDGTGYGTDGTLWGGEFLIADYENFRRIAHLASMPLPGGDKATRQPWRVALSWLYHSSIKWTDDLAPVRAAVEALPGTDPLAAIQHQLEYRINTPLTSSIGRLFDAAAALAGIRQTVNFEAQAAIEFEAIADPHEEGYYPFEITSEAVSNENDLLSDPRSMIIDTTPLLHDLIADLQARTPLPIISSRFHNGVAEMVKNVVIIICKETGISQIALSGGVWQNMELLARTVVRIQRSNLHVLLHRQVPPNDGGISLGQALIGYHRLVGHT